MERGERTFVRLVCDRRSPLVLVFTLMCTGHDCLASFDVYASTGGHSISHCRFCGAELLEHSYLEPTTTPDCLESAAVQAQVREAPWRPSPKGSGDAR